MGLFRYLGLIVGFVWLKQKLFGAGQWGQWLGTLATNIIGLVGQAATQEQRENTPESQHMVKHN